MAKYSDEVTKNMNKYMHNPNSIDKEVHDLKHAIKGAETRGALAASVSKSFTKSEESETKANEAHEVMESIMSEGFDNATLENNFAQKLDDEIAGLQPEWTQFKDDTEMQLADIGNLVDLPDGNITLKPYFKESINVFKNSLSSELPKMLFLTDVHYEHTTLKANDYDKYTKKGLQYVLIASELSDSVDLIITGGDNINGYNRMLENIRLYNKQFCDTLFDLSVCPVIINQGDHDNGSATLRRDNNRIITEKELKKDYRTKQMLAGEVRNGDSIYCYKDYPKHKLRIVSVNTNDVPYILDNGEPRYRQHNELGMRHEQLNWIANTALQLPSSEWSVIMAGHNPIYGANGTGKYFHNAEVIGAIIQAFRNKETLSISKTDNQDFSTTIQSDFTNAGTFIANIAGHIHRDMVTDDYGHKIITSASASPVTTNLTRDIGTVNETAIDVFEIDTTNKVIYTKRFGAGENRTIKY